MKCPKCQHEQPDGTTECAKCGLIFAKWRPEAEPPPPSHPSEPPPGSWRPQAPEPVAAPTGGGRTMIRVIALLAVAAGFYWFFFWAAAGLPVAEQAYRDADRGFALVPPQGWQPNALKDCKTVGDSLSAAQACRVLELRRETDGGRGGPTIQVTVVPIGALFKTGWGGSVRIEERDKDEMAEVFEQGVAKSVEGFTPESRDVVRVDNIAALRVVGSASFKGIPTMVGDKMMTIPDFSGQISEVHLTMGSVLVPGGTQAYLIAYGCESADGALMAGVFDETMASFRVTAGRPTPFQSYGGLMGSMKGDLILGALVGIGLAILKL